MEKERLSINGHFVLTEAVNCKVSGNKVYDVWLIYLLT